MSVNKIATNREKIILIIIIFLSLIIDFSLLQELELRIETQKQTLQARDESIKKLLEMLQNKGMGETLLAISLNYFN